MATYYCATNEPFDVDVDVVDWDENGECRIECPVPGHDHEITIAEPVSKGF